MPILGEDHSLKILTGNNHRDFVMRVCRHIGVSLAKAFVGRFSDGEIRVELLDNVRGQDTFIVQSISHPCNDHLMEVLLLADALRRASARRITAVIPYFAYSRQDRRPRSARVPISSRLVADMLCAAGVNRVLMMDVHTEQIQGFFNVPVDNIYATPLLLADIFQQEYDDLPLIISPDIGGVARARSIAKCLNTDLAIIDKRRPAPNEAEVVHIIGDPAGRTCIMIDDIVDTGTTLCRSAEALKKQGAQRVLAYCTHPVLSQNAIDIIERSPLDKLVVTDTIPLKSDALACSKIRQLSIAHLLAETISRISHEESLSTLFSNF